jgi:hypothetical protein
VGKAPRAVKSDLIRLDFPVWFIPTNNVFLGLKLSDLARCSLSESNHMLLNLKFFI